MPKKNSPASLILTKDLFIGAGAHKKTFVHPNNSSLCVKICYVLPDVDMEKELRYRSVLKNRNRNSLLLPKYYGTVDTNLGTGFVYERIYNYDNSEVVSLHEVFTQAQYTAEYSPILEKLLFQFKENFLKECIVTSNTENTNFLIQKVSAQSMLIRIVDNIGTPAHLPLVYYIDYFAKQRAKRYWHRYINELRQGFPDIMTRELYEKLLIK